MTRKTTFILLAALLLPLLAPAQGTREDYDRVSRMRRLWRSKVAEFRPSISWLPDGKGIWWEDRGPNGQKRYIVVAAATGERRVVTDPAAFGISTEPVELPPQSSRGRSPAAGTRTTITFINKLQRKVRLFWSNERRRVKAYGEIEPGATRELSTYVGHVWMANFTRDDVAGIFIADARPGTATINEASRRAASAERDRGKAPRPFRARIEGHNVVGIDADGEKFSLSTNGTAEDAYRAPREWSPDGTKALTFQVTKVETRRVPMVESSPKDGTQPKLHWMNYAKPGDAIAQSRPRLFDFEGKRQIPVDEAAFTDSWRVDRVHWAPDGSRVYCLYNKRGHQQLALRAIDAKTGAVTTIIDESPETFVDYSQKTWMHWLDDAGQILWASERDGWNHLYRFDAKTGKLVNQITKGPWVVRRVEKVDVAKRQIWFTAVGIHEGQNPYFEHLARVNFDGSGLTVLTSSNGHHKWTFSPDRSMIVATWSRVDQPRVTELRRVSDGKLIAELGRDDATKLLETGFRPPQPFVAKGRDGKTDIWGVIIRPSNFDPSKRYPVIESIYAGPHGHHAPKTWGMSSRQRTLAELGFILVQMDGMGTNWRSKAFHDVCWQNLMDGGFPDRIAWMRAAAKAHPELDLDRVGIFGGSAGGQNALAAMLKHGDFYKAAAADCGCHDNRMDKIWWNEAWMGAMGPHYAANSNVTHAGKLQGKLLLTVGELDRNVDPASTMQVVDALIRADKDFDMIVVPGAGHGVGGRPYMVRRRQDFFVRALMGVEPRR